MQGCAKQATLCGADAGTTTADCMQGCVSSETTSTGGACSNQSAILAAGNACLAKTTCAELELCVATTVPACAGGTGGTSGTGTGGAKGTGGTSGGGGAKGTGGTSGAAGGSGTADCSICDKAQTCCVAVLTLAGQSTSSCTYSAARCNAAGAAQATDISICQQILSAGAGAVAACK
jgi:hypothetical protein